VKGLIRHLLSAYVNDRDVLRAVLEIVLQMPIDMFKHTLRGKALKLRLTNISVSRPVLFYRVTKFTVGSPLIKSATAMCKYVRRWERYLKLQSIQHRT